MTTQHLHPMADELGSDEEELWGFKGSMAELEFEDWELEGLSHKARMALEKRRLFLRAYSVRGLITDGANAAGISHQTHKAWIANSEWFAKMFEIASQEAIDRIEGEAYRRAVDGYDEAVLYLGLPTVVIDSETGREKQVTIRKYSDTLMNTLLKGSNPEKFRDNVKVEHAGNAGGVLLVPSPIDAASWEQAVKAQQAKYTGNQGTTDSPLLSK
jgi:hypothetical protein